MGFMLTILLLGCQRYDILNKLYQDSGQWNKALDICENNDRIHLRNTYYNFAKVHGGVFDSRHYFYYIYAGKTFEFKTTISSSLVKTYEVRP